MSRARSLRLVLPWVIAAGILAWIFSAVPFQEFARALSDVPPLPFLALTVLFVTLNLLADAAASLLTLRYALPEARPSFRELVTIRGATYLLALINYGVGQGGIAYYLNQRHAVAVPRAAGGVLLMAGVNLCVLAGVAAAGIAAGGTPPQPALRTLVYAAAAGFPVYLVFVLARPSFLRRFRLLGPIFDAGLTGNLLAAAARVPHFVILVTGHFVAMRLFGIRPTFGETLTLLPMVFFVAVVPVSPLGLGTAQATAIALFSRFAGPAGGGSAPVLAYSLTFQVACTLLQAPLGLACLQRLGRTGNVEAGA